jgi:hypothetical protein
MKKSVLLPKSVLGVTKILVTQLTVTPEKNMTTIRTEHIMITPGWKTLAGKVSTAHHLCKVTIQVNHIFKLYEI